MKSKIRMKTSEVLGKAGLLLWFALAGSLPQANAVDAKRTNIINILVDDMGYSDLGCYGGEIKTPNIDSLAKGGLRFSSYRTYPKCFPTRNSILSGIESDPINFQEDAMNIAELLKMKGYRTYFVGKTHGNFLPDLQAVARRGFDRSFGNEAGGSFFNHKVKQCYLDGKEWHTDEPFYKTDVQTDFALEFLDSYKESRKPFFLHLAYHAPHYPLHAKPEDIAKYRGKYLQGPNHFRKTRFAKLKELGLINPEWKLSPSSDDNNEWEKLSAEDKNKYDHLMAVYAAMIDNVDQNIGRVMTKLKEMGCFENTLITFSSDNGACPEGSPFNIWSSHTNQRFGVSYDETAEIGSAKSHWKLGEAWANMSSTPFRMYKNYCHEGGLSSPLIVHWSGKVDEPGSISHEFVSVYDFMPSWLEVAKAEYPMSFEGRKIEPLVGESFLPLLNGGVAEDKERTALFWYKSKSTVCFIKGKWKIVTLDCSKFENSKWELYDIIEDRTEQNDLSAKNSEKLSEMKKALVESFSDHEAYDSFTKQFVKKSKKGKTKKKTKK